MLGDDALQVRPPPDTKQPLFFHLQHLVTELPKVIVRVSRGVVCVCVWWVGCVCVGGAVAAWAGCCGKSRGGRADCCGKSLCRLCGCEVWP